jgi:manganese/iron transport system substrate-binding protein
MNNMTHRTKLGQLIVIVFCGIIMPTFSLAADKKIKVITTFTVIADMARNVAGNAATIESITKPGAEIHGYQPTPRDIVKAQNADLVLWNGLNLELWFEQFFSNISDVPSVTISDGITPLGISEGEYKGKPNPHAWMSLSGALTYVDNIKKALIKYDNKNRLIYEENAKNYSNEIIAVISPLKNTIMDLPANKRWLVTCEGAFSYLIRDFNLKELYLWPINSNSQGTPQQVKKVVDAVRENKINAVFCESTVSQSPAKQVARETGSKYGGMLYVDSLTEKDGVVPTYLELLRVTSQTISKGLLD